MFYRWQMYLGDGIHLLAISGLLMYIWHHKSCTGISGKTQILHCLVYTARYLDLFSVFYSTYNMLFKIIYLAIPYITALSIYCKFKETNSSKQDNFRFELLVIGAGLLAIYLSYDVTLLEVMWTFSEFLEAVAIIPQLYLLYEMGEAENSVTFYVMGLLCYRALYFWHYTNKVPQEIIGLRSALVQTFIYVDYLFTLFCLKLTKKLQQKAKKYQAVSDKNYNYPVFVVTCDDLTTKGGISKV